MDLRTALHRIVTSAVDSALVREQECRVDPEVASNPQFTFEGFKVSGFKAEMILTFTREDGAVREIKVNPEVSLKDSDQVLDPPKAPEPPPVSRRSKAKPKAKKPRR